MDGTTRTTRTPAPRALGGLSALATTLLVMVLHPLGLICSHFHVSTGIGNYILGLVLGGGGWTLSVFFPEVLPFILTIRGLVAAFGVGFAVGW